MQLLGDNNFSCRCMGQGVIWCSGSLGLVHQVLSANLLFEVRRYLDKYILVFPDNCDRCQQVVDAFFSNKSFDYDQSVDQFRNIENINNLFSIVRSCGLSENATILDYGCGSGVSASIALPSSWTMLGVDRCADMRCLASANGLSVLSPSEFNVSYLSHFDAIFSSYAMHLVYSTFDLRALWQSLRENGVFVANFHKGYGVKRISLFFEQLGAVVVSAPFSGNVYDHGPYIIFRKGSK